MSAAIDFETARHLMLAQQVRAWDVNDERVLAALRDTPRERFAPARYRDLAFADTEIPLGHGEYMLAPRIEGRLLQALRLRPPDRVLEVGTGSGYLAACLARLTGSVLSVDYHADFIEAARRKLEDPTTPNVGVEVADALGLTFRAEFDAIAVTGSVPELDGHFIRMLRPGGRLFIVVGRPPIMEARLVTMHANGEWTEESLFETVLKPLINAERPRPFEL